MQANLLEFFAVTKGKKAQSIYRIGIEGDSVVARKIALSGESSFSIDRKLEDGNLIGVMKKRGLLLYTGGRSEEDEGRMERPEEVNSIFWGDHTSPIVALFSAEEDARACFAAEGLVHWDPRWEEETQLVLRAIGDDHRYFILSRHPESVLRKKPEAAWAGDESACGSLTERC